MAQDAKRVDERRKRKKRKMNVSKIRTMRLGFLPTGNSIKKMTRRTASTKK
jgi:hypothetical protein